MPKLAPPIRILVYLVFLCGIGAVSLFIPRTHGFWISIAFFGAFASYLMIAFYENHEPMILSAGLIARLAVTLGLPSLSDDFYRFIWDGELMILGINPFQYVPASLQLTGLTDPELFRALNSPNYFSVYPPLNQALFWLSATLSGAENWLGFVNVLRLIFIFAETGSYFLLKRILERKGESTLLASFYFLNPLVILEITGNVHFEGLVIFFLLLAYYQLIKRNYLTAGVALGLSCATKLLPFIFLPYLLWRYRWKNGLCVAGTALATFLFLSFPMLAVSSRGIAESLRLYFQLFEFNASIYYLAREIGFLTTGFNWLIIIGPALSILTLVIILTISYHATEKIRSTERTFLLILFAYLILATTVHPWYVIPLVPFGILSGYRFPIVWTGAVFVTYWGYTDTGYTAHLGVIALEYLVVFGVFIYEVFIVRKLES